jgi:hypothetical protein
MRSTQNPRFKFPREACNALSQVPTVKPSDPLFDESFVPARNKNAAALDPLRIRQVDSVCHRRHLVVSGHRAAHVQN